MVVKGIIKSIDVQGNTCTVRMPYFENVGNDEIVATATVSNSPGSYNGYKVNDVVWVAFENDQLECPVIIGKLYLGIEAERADPRGTLNVVDSKISRTAEIPFDTKLSRDIEPGMPKTIAPYNSLNSIANNLSTAEVNIAQNDREYGNRFSLAFENIEGNKSLINQTANRLSTEIDERIDADGVLKSTIEQTAEKMVAKVSGYKKDEEGNYILDEPKEFGWDLQSDKWTVFSQDGEILIADEVGLEVRGKIEAEEGHIGSFIIGKEDANGHSGIYSDTYIESFEETASSSGVYVGTDGIKLGQNFSVDTTGHVTATSITLQPSNISGLEQTLNGIDNSISNINNAGYQTASQVTQITDSRISTAHLSADQIITGSLTIGDKFSASIDNSTINIGGFTVENNRLTNLFPAETVGVNKGKCKGVGMSAADSSFCWAFWAGHQSGDGTGHGDKALGWDAPFRVGHQGELVATSAAIEGNITAKTLTITDGATVTGLKANHINVKGLNADGITIKQRLSTDKDETGNTGPIVFETNATEGTVTIGGFEVGTSAISKVEEQKQVTLSTSGISLGVQDDNGDYPFLVDAEGGIFATTGTFSGAINASDAILNNVNELTMADDSSASFYELTTSNNVNVGGRLNSANGYFFGTGTECGFTLAESQTIQQKIQINATVANAIPVGGGTSYRYSIFISCTDESTGKIAPVVADTEITLVNSIIWGEGTNKVIIPANTKTIIKAGSSSAILSKTVVSSDRFSDLKYTLMTTDLVSEGRAISNPTKPNVSKATITPSKITQNVTDNTGNISLDCNNFVMNGSIQMTGDVTSKGNFYVTNEKNENIATLNSDGLKVDGSVKFKKNGVHYEPVIQLAPNNSNCLYTTMVTIATYTEGTNLNQGASWKSVKLPAGLYEYGLAKVKGAYVTGYLSSKDNLKVTSVAEGNCGKTSTSITEVMNMGTQGYTPYVSWDNHYLYVLLPPIKVDSNVSPGFTIKMCVLIVGAI